MKKIGIFVLLNVILLAYSFCGVFTKIAAQYDFLSLMFIVFYGISLIIMVVYAFLWQRILKHIPLNIAFANKAVIIIWGLLWSVLIFNDNISLLQVIGAATIVIGVLIAIAGGENKNEK